METNTPLIGLCILLGIVCIYLIITLFFLKKNQEEELEVSRNKGFKEGAGYIIKTLDFNLDGITDAADVKKMFGIYNKLKRQVDREGGAIKNVL